VRIEADYHSDKGDRENNEDRAAVLEAGRVCLVADGMGGQSGGEIASRLAVETVREGVEAGPLEELSGEEEVYRELGKLFQEANRRIVESGLDRPLLRDMGTTLTLALLGEGRLFFAHMGDSRLYAWRDGDCRKLTEDHTEAQEFVRQGWLSASQAIGSRYRHTLSRFLGTARSLEPQFGSCEVRAGDRFLLCSDGLYGAVETDQLTHLLGQDGPAKERACCLVAAASDSGCKRLDNITALVVKVDG